MASAWSKERTSRSVMPYVAYGVVLVLLFAAGFAVWTMGRGGRPSLPGRDAASLPVPAAPAGEAARTARALKLPPRPPEPAASPARQEPASTPLPPPDVGEKKPELSKSEPGKSDPGKPECKVDFTRWPADRSDQAKAIQILLRDLGFYRGTTNGTAGPATRAAIREFQLAAGDAETGEVTEALFEALRKKCAASAN